MTASAPPAGWAMAFALDLPVGEEVAAVPEWVPLDWAKPEPEVVVVAAVALPEDDEVVAVAVRRVEEVEEP